jgi:hypothetical protein
MKLNKIHILICLCLAFATNAMAQNSNTLILKKIKLNLLEKVDEYSRLSGFNNDDDRDEFYGLFVSDTVLLNNDIMPDNNLMQKLTVKEYVNEIPNNYPLSIRTYIRPYDIGIGNLIDSNIGEYWVDAKKSIIGSSKSGTRYIDSTFDIRLTFMVNYYTGQYKITDITLNKERGRYLVITAYKKGSFKKKVMSIDTILIENKPILLDEKGQYLIKDFKPNISVVPHSDMYYGSYNLTNKDLDFVLTHKEKENNIDLYFRQSVFFLEPNFSFNSFSNFAPIKENNNTDINQANSFSYSLGLNIGYSLYVGKNGYWNIKTGFSLYNLSYTNTITSLTESYNATDADQGNYVRTNQISNLTEKHDVQYYAIPLHIEKGFSLKKGYSIYINSGASFILGLQGNRNTETNAGYSGYYKDLYGLTIKENGVYDFGTYKLQKASSLNTVANLITVDLGMGVSKKISKKISARLGFTYQQSLSSVFENNSKSISTNKNELNSITQSYNDFRINLFLINIGLKYNL